MTRISLSITLRNDLSSRLTETWERLLGDVKVRVPHVRLRSDFSTPAAFLFRSRAEYLTGGEYAVISLSAQQEGGQLKLQGDLSRENGESEFLLDLADNRLPLDSSWEASLTHAVDDFRARCSRVANDVIDALTRPHPL